MKRTYLIILIVLVLAVSAGVGGGWWYFSRPSEHEGRLINRIRTIDNNWVEIELYSPKPFPVLNAAMIMGIGDKTFFFGGITNTVLYTVAFRLSPDQWATVRDGDPVIITYKGWPTGWTFGPIDKSRLDKGPILP
ncbi:MAG: hypothetical protein MUD01_16710 [Chloroflexaceae bacterium]|jgi:hypothetical protein|nr:hypothetical protein [Chloroflexaceae bacterium]